MSAPPACECGAKHWRSISAFSTAAGIHTFHDEEGRRHAHDPNKTTAEIECMECHRTRSWSYFRECWCGWIKGGVR